MCVTYISSVTVVSNYFIYLIDHLDNQRVRIHVHLKSFCYILCFGMCVNPDKEKEQIEFEVKMMRSKLNLLFIVGDQSRNI